MKTIQIGIIGAGDNTRRRHIPGLLAQPGVELRWVCNRSVESGRKVAETFNIPQVADYWQQVVDAGDVDAIVIGTWPYLHAEISCAALQAGKHVLCEARMARDAAEARQMLAVSQTHPQLIAQVVPSPFSLEVDVTIQRLLSEGFTGALNVIEHRQASDFPLPPEVMHWRMDRHLSGLNIMGLGIVYEMLMRWVGEAVDVSASGKILHPEIPDAEGKMVPNLIPQHLDVIAKMACGAQLHLQQSQSTPLLDGGGTWLYGTEGVLRFHEGVLTGARRGEDALSPIPIPEHERGGWRVEEEFVQAIRGKEPIQYTRFEDGVRYMEFTEAVHRSMQEGRHISLPLNLDSP